MYEFTKKVFPMLTNTGFVIFIVELAGVLFFRKFHINPALALMPISIVNLCILSAGVFLFICAIFANKAESNKSLLPAILDNSRIAYLLKCYICRYSLPALKYFFLTVIIIIFNLLFRKNLLFTSIFLTAENRLLLINITNTAAILPFIALLAVICRLVEIMELWKQYKIYYNDEWSKLE